MGAGAQRCGTVTRRAACGLGLVLPVSSMASLNRCADRPRTNSPRQPPASRLAAASSGTDPILHLRRRLGKGCTAWITFFAPE
jgi:hypothetical protein